MRWMRLNIEEFVQLGARWVVDLDQSVPFLGLLLSQEVERLLDAGHLFLGATVATVVGDDRDNSWNYPKKKIKIKIYKDMTNM